MVYEDCKIYGPYDHSDNTGRKIVQISFPDGKKKTTSYARYSMECFLNRFLENWEEVDHKDDDCTNDSLSNLQVITGKANREKTSNTPMYEFDCPVCGIEAEVEYRVYKRNQLTLKKAGPYCSKRCAGKAHN